MIPWVPGSLSASSSLTSRCCGAQAPAPTPAGRHDSAQHIKSQDRNPASASSISGSAAGAQGMCLMTEQGEGAALCVSSAPCRLLSPGCHPSLVRPLGTGSLQLAQATRTDFRFCGFGDASPDSTPQILPGATACVHGASLGGPLPSPQIDAVTCHQGSSFRTWLFTYRQHCVQPDCVLSPCPTHPLCVPSCPILGQQEHIVGQGLGAVTAS